MEPIKIVNIWPSFLLMNDYTNEKRSHLIYIETFKTPIEDADSRQYSEEQIEDQDSKQFRKEASGAQCFFMPTSELRSGLYKSTQKETGDNPLGSLVVDAVRLNDTDAYNNTVSKDSLLASRTFYTC